MRQSLNIRTSDFYVVDPVVIDVMAAPYPTSDRAHLMMQMFGAMNVARCLATLVAFPTRLARTGTRTAPDRS